jgi:hypothetical protein
MHGYGLSGDLLHMSLYLLTIVAWLYLWMICVFNSSVPLKKRLGTHALLICALGLPSMAAVLVFGALLVFGLEYIIWSLLLVGVGLPMAGAGALRHGWYKKDHA